MRASTLTGIARRCFLVAKALECVSQSIQQTQNRCPLRSIAPRAYAWSARDIERFYEARAILLDALASPPPVAELARSVGVNARKLSDGFRDLFGEPIYAFVKNRRFEEAKRMIEAGEHSIGHVARTMGYQQQHFSTEFRHRYGVAPKSLRAKQSRHTED
nr:AraC family transcriptional regulator [Methylobacterium bullatum]